MKHLFSLLLTAILALPPALAAALAEPVFPPGSGIGLEPPDGMVRAESFAGFVQPQSGTSILLVEMPAAAFGGIASGFTSQALAEQGINEESREAVPIADAEAFLVTGTQRAGASVVRKWILVAGGPGRTAIVTVQMPAGPPPFTNDEIRQALLSLTFRTPPAVEEQLAALPFRITERAGFRPTAVMAGSAAAFTDGPLDTVPAMEQPLLVITAGLAAPPPTREAFAIRLLHDIAGLSGLRIETTESRDAAGLFWITHVATGTHRSGLPVAVFQAIGFSDAAYLRAVGIVRQDLRDPVLPRFREVIKGLSLH